jgi:hypothetical protein
MRVAFFKFLGRTFLCPDSSLKEGDIVCSLLPLKQIDPLNKYQFVSDGSETHSVSKKQLQLLQTGAFDWQRKQFMTHNQEVASQIKDMNNYFNSIKPKILSYVSCTGEIPNNKAQKSTV